MQSSSAARRRCAALLGKAQRATVGRPAPLHAPRGRPGRAGVPAAVDALRGVLEVQLQALLRKAGVAAHDDRPLPAPAAAAAGARGRQARDVKALRAGAQGGSPCRRRRFSPMRRRAPQASAHAGGRPWEQRAALSSTAAVDTLHAVSGAAGAARRPHSCAGTAPVSARRQRAGGGGDRTSRHFLRIHSYGSASDTL